MAWKLEGTYFESCSCEVPCPCTVSFSLGADYDRWLNEIKPLEVKKPMPAGGGVLTNETELTIDPPMPWTPRSLRTGDPTIWRCAGTGRFAWPIRPPTWPIATPGCKPRSGL